MNPKYSDFLERNPTFQKRIEAFTSGILTPDPKPIVLSSMEPEIFYTAGELYQQVKSFAGGRFPISYAGVWSYCNGNAENEGSLYTFGAVTKDEGAYTPEMTLIPNTFAKTPAGKDFGDAIAARALQLSGKLTSRYRSMLRVFGATNKPRNARSRRGFAVYKVIKLLAENPRKIYRKADIAECTGLPVPVLCLALNSLGQAGIIDYESSYREKNGRRLTGWAQYRLVDKSLLRKQSEELYVELRKERPRCYLKTYLESVIECIKNDPDGIYSTDSFRILKIDSGYISKILSFLKRRGFLESDYQGGVIQSKAKANKNTHLIWESLLKPIEAIADRLDANDYKGFYEALQFYESSPDTRENHTQRMLAQYDRERLRGGSKSSDYIDSILVGLSKKVMKLSEITELVNRSRTVNLRPDIIRYHLRGLIRSGTFEKPEKGFYRRK